MFLLFLVGVIAIANHSNDKGSQWKNDTKQQITNLEKSISKENSKGANANQDEIKFQQSQLQILQYRLENDIPDNVITPYRFIYNCNALIGLIVLFMAIFSENIIANEYSWGTIRQLLVRPVKRWKIYLAKYLSAVIVGIILSAILLIISSIIGLIVFSKNSSSIYEVVLLNGVIVKRNMLSYVLLSSLSNIFSIAVICSLTFLVASLIKTTGLAIVTTLFVYFAGFIGGTALANKGVYKFILTPNLSLSQYLPCGQAAFKGGTLLFSIIICLIYLILFLTGGMIIFSKRDVY